MHTDIGIRVSLDIIPHLRPKSEVRGCLAHAMRNRPVLKGQPAPLYTCILLQIIGFITTMPYSSYDSRKPVW
jgi:hypothetical protein